MLLYKNPEEANQSMEDFPPAYWRAHTRGLDWRD